MKICNFLRYDPTYDGVGLSRGNKLEKEIWETNSDNLSLLKEVASRIKTVGKSETLRNKIKNIEIDEAEEASEGRTLLKLHKYRESNQSIKKKKKAFVLQ